MKAIKCLFEILGFLFGLVWHPKFSEYWNACCAHFYTAAVRRYFANWGKGALIACPTLKLHGIKRISIGEGTQISSGAQLMTWRLNDSCAGSIVVGRNCILREGISISATTSVCIGNNLLTGVNVLITDNSHGQFEQIQLQQAPNDRPLVDKGPVCIGNNVWLGNNVCIMPGVNIGDGVIVGANSIVTHDIPSYSMAAGIPAKVIKKL